MTGRPRPPLAILAASLAAGAAALLLGPGPLRALLGAALVLVLPGAALTVLLGGGLGTAERVLATLAASIAVAVLAGLAIGNFGSGFDAPAWLAMLTGVAVAGSLGALVVSLRRRPAPRVRGPRIAPATVACGLAAAAIAVFAVVIAHRSGERNAARAAAIVNLVSPAAARAEARAREAALAAPVRRARVVRRRGGTR